MAPWRRLNVQLGPLRSTPVTSRLTFILKRLRERLWVRPLTYCLLSVSGAFVAKAADQFPFPSYAPEIAPGTNDALLSIMAASMLVIATLAVTSMVSAYSSASSAATPRSFPLIVADDVSQKALSTFLGAFIYSIVALVAVENGYYGQFAHLVLFVVTLAIFAVVVLTFVRWVDAIARLGRLGTAIDKVEAAAAEALEQRARFPALGGLCRNDISTDDGEALSSDVIGYVQHINVARLQELAEKRGVRIHILSLPGRFVTPERPLAVVLPGKNDAVDVSDGRSFDAATDSEALRDAFLIGDDRVYDDDPRFGIIVLSEIAGKALSPAVNDPGTAIDIIGTITRLLIRWDTTRPDEERDGCFDRVSAPALVPTDLFDDAFTAISRDGAGQVEVAIRLQKALAALAATCSPEVAAAATKHAAIALQRAEHAMKIDADLQVVRAAAG